MCQAATGPFAILCYVTRGSFANGYFFNEHLQVEGTWHEQVWLRHHHRGQYQTLIVPGLSFRYLYARRLKLEHA